MAELNPGRALRAIIDRHPRSPAASLGAGQAPLVCGIVNVTPDSFSDGGRYVDPAAAIDHGLALIAQGADLLDIGGESTRPGARATVGGRGDRTRRPCHRGRSRVRRRCPISIDTSRPAVMREAVAAGACFINDVRALRYPSALTAAAELNVPVCLVMRGEPHTMQRRRSMSTLWRKSALFCCTGYQDFAVAGA